MRRDLSHPTEDGMPVYPGDPTVSVEADADGAPVRAVADYTPR